ncbi:MAG: hypothetical protein O3C40_26880 [Planctomycetota bacterium]|nr:hypothetical protein [Planctomycetota bacterium]
MVASTTSHSAIVRLVLRVNGQKIPLAQLGADFAIPVTPVSPPSGDAEIVISVDGEITRLPVVVEKSEAGRILLGHRMVY